MHLRPFSVTKAVTSLFILSLPTTILGADVLQTDGFSTCLSNSDINVTKSDVEYDKGSNTVTFDVAGSSAKSQKVKATITVTAYGKQVYQNSFDPCEQNIELLCPVPEGNFAANGSFPIPSNYANMIPSIAFNIPDIDGMAKLVLTSADSGQDLACLQSTITNGKTASVNAVSYVTAGVAAAALALTGVSAVGAIGAHGAGTTAPSPTFGDCMLWFQAVATNGMYSVNYPQVYRSFTKNFGWSTGLISWGSMQQSIDTFRSKTGGNLTDDSYTFIRNSTLVFSDPSTNNTKRDLEAILNAVYLRGRALSTTINGTTTNVGGAGGSSSGSSSTSKPLHLVHGVEAYAEQLAVPKANTFMTVLLVFAVVIAAIVVAILLFKVILETWALFASFPKGLTGFRKRYWGVTGRTIVNLVLILYGVWTLYCIYQFTAGDSWAAKLLAGVTLSAFTALLGLFTWKIWSLARRYKKLEGSADPLYDNKEVWIKYSLFYDQYKKDLWWIFIPLIVYMFAKGCIIAGGDGHGTFQAIGQLVCEALLLFLLLWRRPYHTKAGNWIHIVISIVRVLSVACLLVFAEVFNIGEDAKTVTGVALIVTQSVLTGVLAILIAVNALIVCCKTNPHRQRRKEAEKLEREFNLTPLDARNSLLVDPEALHKHAPSSAFSSDGRGAYSGTPTKDAFQRDYRDYSAGSGFGSDRSTENLVKSAAPLSSQHDRNLSGDTLMGRQPTLPMLQPYSAYRGNGGY
jgi:hypothetical protein